MFADAMFVVCYGTLLITTVAAATSRGTNAQIRDSAAVTDGYSQRSPSSTRSCCGGSSTAVTDDSRSPRDVPLNLIIELNQVKNITDLFNKFMPDVNMHEAQYLIANTGFQSNRAASLHTFAERRASLIPKPAGCSVEVQTISLKDTDDSSLYYYPPCTRVNRCGGCCAHDLLACQPTKSESLNFEVMVSQYNGAGKLEFIGRKAVTVVQHLKCKCDCIIKPENCSPLQTYYRDECRCVCNNEEDRDKCSEEHELKLWNPANCLCQCRVVQECTSGFGFDYNTCRCEALRTRTKSTSNQFTQHMYALDAQ